MREKNDHKTLRIPKIESFGIGNLATWILGKVLSALTKDTSPAREESTETLRQHEWSLPHASPEWHRYIDRIFRLAPDRRLGKNAWLTLGDDASIREYFMYQRTGNCFLISALNALLQNRHFLTSLSQNLEYFPHKSRTIERWWYTFSDGTYTEVTRKELGNEYFPWFGDDDIYLETLSYVEEQRLIQEIAYTIIHSTQDPWHESKFSHIQMPVYDTEKNTYKDEYGRTRIRYTDDFMQMVRQSLHRKQWVPYEIARILLGKQTLSSVRAPLGYKVLETLYLKRFYTPTSWSHRFTASENGWDGSRVLRNFLPKKHWTVSYPIGTRGTLDTILIINILKEFHSGNTILLCGNDMTRDFPLYTFEGDTFAFWHVYSVIDFDRESETVHVVNPWDNRKVIPLALRDFLGIFDYVTIAEKNVPL